MNTYADKTQENKKSQSVTNVVSQKQNGSEFTFQFVDNRPDAVAQRKLLEVANNGPQAKIAAPLPFFGDNRFVEQQQREQNTPGATPTLQRKPFITNDGGSSQPIQRKPLTDEEHREVGEMVSNLEEFQKDCFKRLAQIEEDLQFPFDVPTDELSHEFLSLHVDINNFYERFDKLLEHGAYDRHGIRKLKRWTKEVKKSGWQDQLESIEQGVEVLNEKIAPVKAIEKRRAIYQEEIGRGSRDKSDIPGDIRTEAVVLDPSGDSQLGGWVSVEDAGGTPSDLPGKKAEARDALGIRNEQGRFGAEKQVEWSGYLDGDDIMPPRGADKVKFENLFRDGAAIMLENYRPYWKEFFASDVFFDQWLASAGGDSVMDLPESFPEIIYRNHIDNDNTLAAIKKIYNERYPENDRPDVMIVTTADQEWGNLSRTPNVGSTLNILAEYNRINAARDLGEFKAVQVSIYGQHHNKNLKIEFTGA